MSPLNDVQKRWVDDEIDLAVSQRLRRIYIWAGIVLIFFAGGLTIGAAIGYHQLQNLQHDDAQRAERTTLTICQGNNTARALFVRLVNRATVPRPGQTPDQRRRGEQFRLEAQRVLAQRPCHKIAKGGAE